MMSSQTNKDSNGLSRLTERAESSCTCNSQIQWFLETGAHFSPPSSPVATAALLGRTVKLGFCQHVSLAQINLRARAIRILSPLIAHKIDQVNQSIILLF